MKLCLVGTVLTLCSVYAIANVSHGDPYLLFATRSELRQLQLTNVTALKPEPIVLADGLRDVTSLDFHHGRQIVFWAEKMYKVINFKSMTDPLASFNVANVGEVSPDGLAIDWIGNHIYWTDSDVNRIEVSSLDGKCRRVLVWKELDEPRTIAVDPTQGFMYWADWGEEAKIERIGMNGEPSTREVIIDTNIFWPYGLTLDYEDSRIYWSDVKNKYIHSANFDGSDRHVIIDGEVNFSSLPHPFSLAIFQDRLFWADNQNISSCDKAVVSDHGTRLVDRKLECRVEDSVIDMHISHTKRQPEVSNPCRQNNGGCSDLCLLSPNPPFFTCACPTGIRLNSDLKTCPEGPENMLLLLCRNNIRRISLDTPDFSDIVIPITNVEMGWQVDYDPVHGLIYWTEDRSSTSSIIHRAKLDGTEQEVMKSMEEGSRVSDIAVDWMAGNVYWTDRVARRIIVARKDDAARKAIVSKNLMGPSVIELDVEQAMMYWIDCHETRPVCNIEQAFLDGTNRMVLVSSEGHGRINGLALDLVNRRLYWGSAQNRIESVDLKGFDRQLLAEGDGVGPLFGFSVFEDRLYWTDTLHRTIKSIDIVNGSMHGSHNEEMIPSMMGLRATKRHISLSDINTSDNACVNDNGGCSHLCLNRPDTGAICLCPTGLELQSNGKNCMKPEAILILSQPSEIQRISVPSNQMDKIPLADLEQVEAVDIHMEMNRIYWSDSRQNKIYRSFLNGSAVEAIIDLGLDCVEDLAVDWLAENLYYMDACTHRITMSRLNGASSFVVIWQDLISPEAITVDPIRGYLYWSSGNGKSKAPSIEYSKLDGSSRTNLLTTEAIVVSLTIDFETNRLYWSDDSGRIGSTGLVGLDSNEGTEILLDTEIGKPRGLTTYKGSIYWADWNSNAVYMATLASGRNRTTVHTGLEDITSLRVFHQMKQPGSSPCHLTNGGCSDLCIMIDGEAQCACQSHFTLDPISKNTCTAPSDFLLFSQRTALRRLAPNTKTKDVLDEPDVWMMLEGFRNAKELAYNPRDQRLFWVDGKQGVIKSSVLYNSTKKATSVMSPLQLTGFTVCDVAIDPYTNTIYWTDKERDLINVTRTNGKSLGSVVGPQNQKPRSIALDAVAGLMFWTNFHHLTIERANFDGSDHSVILQRRLQDPTKITLDTQSKMIYWIDIESNAIESATYNGQDRKTLISGDSVQPVGLAVFQEKLYWLDRSNQFIERMDAKQGINRELVVHSAVSETDIIVVEDLSRQSILKHPCGYNNGGCSHICYVHDNQSVCSCPHGLDLSEDRRTCRMTIACQPHEFVCNDKEKRCLNPSWQCDGEEDCLNGADEADCPACAARCSDNSCIHEQQVCNGIQDCTGGVDEAKCDFCHGSHAFHCKYDRVCIADSMRCDGREDCSDGYDEQGCHGASDAHGGSPTAQFTVGIIVGLIGIAFILLFVLFACRRKGHKQLPDSQDMVMASAPLNSVSSNGHANQSMNKKHKKPRTKHGPKHKTKHSLSSTLYDRNNVTGASSSISAFSNYPGETLNPPPSLVTDPSAYTDGYYTSSSSSKPYCYASHKLHTTPCSTDVCEDSEASSCLPYRGYRDAPLGLDTDSEPLCPPPPTPRSSHLTSDPSYPSSPSTDQRYFSPLPPPPPSSVNTDF